MLNIQTLLSNFLDDLEAITTEELLAELEKARQDSQNSYLLDEVIPSHSRENKEPSSQDINVL